MPRKKKQPVPDTLQIEFVVWEDHSGDDNAELDRNIPHWFSIGARIEEDDKILTLLATVNDDDAEDINSASQLTYARILKAAIIKREVISTMPNPFNESPST